MTYDYSLYLWHTVYHFLLFLIIASKDVGSTHIYFHVSDEIDEKVKILMRILVEEVLGQSNVSLEFINIRNLFIKKNIRFVREYLIYNFLKNDIIHLNINNLKSVFVYNDTYVFIKKLINFFRKHNKKIHLVEDGLAIYRDYKVTVSELYKFLYRLVYWVKFTSFIWEFTLYDGVYAVYPSKIRTDIHYKKKYKINLRSLLKLVNRSTIERIINTFNEILFLKGIDKIDLIFVLPHSESLIDINSYIFYLREFLTKVTRENRIKILVKYHPREKNKYLDEFTHCQKIYEIPSFFPIELIYLIFQIYKIKVDFIVWDISTALFTAKELLPNIKVISNYNFIKDNMVNKNYDIIYDLIE